MSRMLLCWLFGHRWQRVRRWQRLDGSARYLWRCRRCGAHRLSRSAELRRRNATIRRR